MAEDCEEDERRQSGIFTSADKKIPENGGGPGGLSTVITARREQRLHAPHEITGIISNRVTQPVFPYPPLSRFECNLSGGRYMVHNARLNGH